LVNVTINDNSASSNGGGICCWFSSPSLESVTITGNSADNGGGIYCHGDSNPSLVNCILWNNSPQEIYFREDYGHNSIMIAYSDIQGGEYGIVTNNNGTVYWEEGNINANPLFVDAENGDYHLTEFSPCIDAGTAFFEWNGEILVDMSEVEYVGFAPDMGAFEWEGVNTDNYELEITNYELHNYPNPFNGATTISFSLTTNLHEKARIEIYNVKGQIVDQLAITNYELGSNQVNYSADKLSSGVYFYKLVVDGKAVDTKKMILLK